MDLFTVMPIEQGKEGGGGSYTVDCVDCVSTSTSSK